MRWPPPSCRRGRIDGGHTTTDRGSLQGGSPLRRLAEDVRESNRQGQSAWARFANHRARVTELLTSASGAGSSLAILGPGNLNDVDVEGLRAAYTQINLLDLDVAAVRSSLGRHGVAGREGVVVHEPVDLTGILDRLQRAVGDEDAAASAIEVLTRHRLDVSGAPFDVTISTGTLTQLLHSVHDTFPSSADAVPVVLALRDKHLADLVDLTRPGGTLVLVTDVVSTTTAPELVEVAPAELEERMAALVASGNFFTGTNPYSIVALLDEDDRFRKLVCDVRLVDPWLWHVTPDRRHLTCAIVARRVATG